MSTDQGAESPSTSDILPSSPLSSLNEDLEAEDTTSPAPIGESGHPLSLLEFAKQIVERNPANSSDIAAEHLQSKRKKSKKKKNKKDAVDICAGMTPAERKAFSFYEDIRVHYDRNNMEGDFKKYWFKRYDLFSQYDHGILMDRESWFSVTPEKIAMHIAERCRADTIIDAFCGSGGNAIQFAFTCERVIAIDIDPVKLHCAKHNAALYGVADRIEFILGDFMQLAPSLKADAVFLSPPWGGPSYINASVFDLETMIPMNGIHLYEAARAISPNIAYFVPRNTDPKQLALLAGQGNLCEVEQNYLQSHLKSLTAYYGELVDPALELNALEDGEETEDVEESAGSPLAAGSKRSIEEDEEEEDHKQQKTN
ncbi:hypothetical protein INT44_003348 [Umbelopsis vinacea]|uniref:Trimethylguanosine synthase n=1 Tax=Umbelopsis vinacea TaxID=44442 RepID=A0A8H7PW90_9FUNG|nr:hypothetical protein INT44_003348 [Umbelopsis vinacea]